MNPQTETGKQGLTRLVSKYLQWIENIEPNFCWYRNHQTMGSTKGRADYDIIFPYLYQEKLIIQGRCVSLAIELKSPTRKSTLSKDQRKQAERIEKAGGEYFIITNLEALHELLQRYGIAKRITLGEFMKEGR